MGEPASFRTLSDLVHLRSSVVSTAFLTMKGSDFGSVATAVCLETRAPRRVRARGQKTQRTAHAFSHQRRAGQPFVQRDFCSLPVAPTNSWRVSGKAASIAVVSGV